MEYLTVHRRRPTPPTDLPPRQRSPARGVFPAFPGGYKPTPGTRRPCALSPWPSASAPRGRLIAPGLSRRTRRALPGRPP